MMNVPIPAPKKKLTWLYDLLFIGILLVGAYFRLSGSNWGDFQNQHPDELFLNSVTLAIQPVHSISQYFDTAHSTLNPHNVGQGFYVYGDLPIIMTRYLAQYLGKMNEFSLFGRQMSALADLGTIALLYFIVKKLYKPGVAVLAALFSALAVMQIQESHYYTTDNFATFFMFLATYFAVVISVSNDGPTGENKTAYFSRLFKDRVFWLSAVFGLTFGMAVASKLNAFPLAILLPVALGVRYFRNRRAAALEPGQPTGIRRPIVEDFIVKNLAFLIIGGLFAVLSFRVFQPYAFSGLGLNPKWVANIREERSQATPDANLDWALQWARRTHLYSFQNLTVWGLGLPLGILAWLGFLWMGWRMLKGEWLNHILLWSWTAGYFIWQSLQYNPTMRYQLPIYPLLAMTAAWFIFWLWDKGNQTIDHKRWTGILRPASVILGVVVLALTAGWAYAFLSIYTHPESRVAASNWIYQNVPGPINLEIKSADGKTSFQQPLPFQAGNVIQADAPFQTAFTAQANGVLNQILVPYAVAQEAYLSADLQISIWQNPDDPQPLASGVLTTSIPTTAGTTSQSLLFDQAPAMLAGQTYTLKVEGLTEGGKVIVCGPLGLSFMTANGAAQQTLDSLPQCKLSSDQPYETQFVAQYDGTLTQVTIAHVDDITHAGTQTVSLTLASELTPQPDQILATASATADFIPTTDPRGAPVSFKLDRPVNIQKNSTYYLSLQTTGGALLLSGGSFANETDLDWTLPFRSANYDPFGGIYRGDLNLEVYWDDNDTKVARFQSTLDQSDYIFIPTNHQYGQITRIPERFPLTTVYYRELLGCPVDKNIIWCYRNAEPGMFHGTLGFDLVATFEDYPTIGPLVINDQGAEEAFTFYDHPKVLIFKKSADYNPANVKAILGAVDTSMAVHLSPGQADRYKSLMLPTDTLAAQQAGGTWSDLFNRNALYNRYPGIGVVLWYVVILILGLFAYPLVRAALPGLADHGYPLARVVGLLLWAWFAWLAGSFGLTYSKVTIAVSLGLIMLIGVWQAWRQRAELKQEFRERWKYFLMVETLFLGFFLIDLMIRLGNSDLWHPAKGGERPMDFAYLNAILKSTSFPPYDPWFAGGYINYYYYGYVIVGTPVKLLGIDPSIAYNFILPTLYACLAMAAFSVGWNLLNGIRDLRKEKSKELQPSSEASLQVTPEPSRFKLFDSRFIAGISASSAMILLGNLGVVKMLYQGFQQIAAPGGLTDHANIFQRIIWAVEGFFLTLVGGMHLPYGPGDWYWFPSRALPDSSGAPITEFPLFTFIYSDLHAHMIAMMITVLAIAWALSVLMARARWKNHLDTVVGLFLGGLVIGAIKPTNTWDFYTYLILCAVVLAYATWRYADVSRIKVNLPEWGKRLAISGGAVAILVGASLLFYQPYTHWYLLDAGYTKVYPWTGGRSDISSYLIHWGVFLFFVVSWMIWETRQWLAETPISAIRKLRPYRDIIIAVLVLLVVILVFQQGWVMRSTQNVPWKGITIVWLALPLAVWAAILLLFRPGISDLKRLVLFMVGTALLLTMVVEFIVLGGDIGRMNTVFKLYVQAWVMLGLSAAASFGWLLSEFRKWYPGWRVAWEVAATALTAGAALFLLMGGMGKIDDRMAPNAPRTLNSMTYMNYSTYSEFGVDLNLSEDYRAIRWMQDNVKGSPVIVEAAPAGVQYAWLGRFSIYTGLPDVIGWEWHQIQQRVIFTSTVIARGREMDAFYETADPQAAQAYLLKYNVRYIIVGQLERAKYTPGGLANPPLENPTVPADAPNGLLKFDSLNGKLWNEVYRDGQTVIYEVPAEEPALP